MDEVRRRRYLEAMGIPLWVARDRGAGPAADRTPAPPSGSASETVASESVAAAPEAVPAPESGVAAEPPVTAPVATLDWDGLAARVAGCTACDLYTSRTQTVFGVGDRAADWVVVGEAPGADEDRQGEPFVGRAGQLLNAMLQAVGLARESVYIANILKCRPPDNRDPLPAEVAACEPHLVRQLELMAPKVILAVGRVAAQNLLRTDAPLSRLRGRVHHYGERDIPVIVTYHPAYLLRNPVDKRKAWADLKAARALVDGESAAS